jgi:trehalose synthase
VVIQKSLREGFGLTVTEALWKKRPVIASAVGGIPLQVVHNLTGLLVHSIEGTAHRIRSLLRDPDFARRLGENGHEYVKTRFLTTSNLRSWLALAISLMHSRRAHRPAGMIRGGPAARRRTGDGHLAGVPMSGLRIERRE